MVTSLLLNLQNAVDASILNPSTVGTEVSTSRPGRFAPEKYTGTYLLGYRFVPGVVCMFRSKENVFTLSEFPTLIPP